MPKCILTIDILHSEPKRLKKAEGKYDPLVPALRQIIKRDLATAELRQMMKRDLIIEKHLLICSKTERR